MFVHHLHATYSQRPEEAIIFPRTGVIDGCEPPCKCWELSPLAFATSKRGKIALNHWDILPALWGIFLFFFLSVIVFFKTGFLCSFVAYLGTSSCRPGWPQIYRDPPGSASWVLGLKASTARLIFFFRLMKFSVIFLCFVWYDLWKLSPICQVFWHLQIILTWEKNEIITKFFLKK